MSRLRCGWKLLSSFTSALSLCAVLAGAGGCATTVSLSRTQPVEVSAAEASAAEAPSLLHLVQLSGADAELVVARAIAEHEMRTP
jgi:hypothetical protein